MHGPHRFMPRESLPVSEADLAPSSTFSAPPLNPHGTQHPLAFDNLALTCVPPHLFFCLSQARFHVHLKAGYVYPLLIETEYQ